MNCDAEKNDFNAASSRAERLRDADFETWFKGSTVVDANGRPVVVYHKTNKSFSLDNFYPLSHFGSAKAADKCIPDTFEGVRVYPVFLNVKNPLLLPDLGNHSACSYKSFFKENGKYLSDSEIIDIFENSGNLENRKFLKNSDVLPDSWKKLRHFAWVHRLVIVLEKKGYDGFFYKNCFEDYGSRSYITFRREQVRSALDGVHIDRDIAQYISAPEIKVLERSKCKDKPKL